METTTNTMSVTRALVELKLLDKRITKAIGAAPLLAFQTDRTDMPANFTKDGDFDKNAKAALAQVTDLIERRKMIKAAIVKSNAASTVEVGGRKFTVADAIERKAGIKYDKALLLTMRSQLANVQRIVEQKNDQMERQLHDLLGNRMTAEGKVADDTKQFQEQYRAMNGTHIHDPLNIQKKIIDLDTEIDEFQSNIDIVLSESNGITMLEL